MSVSSMMTTTGTLQREAVTKDAVGGMVQAFANTAFVDVPCDVQPASSGVRMQYMQRNLAVTHAIYFDQDVSARQTDRFVVGARTFIVNGYLDASAGRGECWRIDAEEQP